MHQKVVEAYRKANFDFQPTTQDLVEQEFIRRTQGSQKDRRIDQIYRVKHGGRDYIVYDVTEIGRDLAKNEYTMTKREGVYELPIFNRQYDNRTGEVLSTNIARTETKYEIPFSRRNMERIIKSATIPSETVFTLDAGYTKFGGLPAHEFMTRHFDDLYDKGMTGKFPEQPRALPDDDTVEREMAERNRAEAKKAREEPEVATSVAEAYGEEEPEEEREPEEEAEAPKRGAGGKSGKKGGRR